MLADLGKQTTMLDYIRSLEGMRAFVRRSASFWNSYDLLLTPTLGLPPPKVGWIFETEDPWHGLARAAAFDPYAPPANVSGQPAVSVPLYWSDDGLPLGVQLIGGPLDAATRV